MDHGTQPPEPPEPARPGLPAPCSAPPPSGRACCSSAATASRARLRRLPPRSLRRRPPIPSPSPPRRPARTLRPPSPAGMSRRPSPSTKPKAGKRRSPPTAIRRAWTGRGTSGSPTSRGSSSPTPRRRPVGLSLRGAFGVDSSGKDFGKEIMTVTEEGLWVDYNATNPVSGVQEAKHTWVILHDGLIFGSGWYDGPPTNPDPAAQAMGGRPAGPRSLPRPRVTFRPSSSTTIPPARAARGMSSSPPATAGTIVAHPTLPEHVGRSLLGPLGTDSAGNEFGSAILGAPTNGRWVSYQFTDPATGEEGMKHTWVVARDQFIFGSGWYE